MVFLLYLYEVIFNAVGRTSVRKHLPSALKGAWTKGVMKGVSIGCMRL